MLKECLLHLQVIKHYVMHVIDVMKPIRIAQVTRPKHPKTSLTIGSMVWLIGRDCGAHIKHLIPFHNSSTG